ncbi:MAG: [acyl-carrier-protein] S-malonyltransferase [Bacilli bacterium]|nr:[acyl-carrier-protein] S-malonyltransferase [Bacilli bacterium]
MTTTAFVFPGQGAQKVGMGKDLAQEFAVARDVFAEADESLGFSLSKIIWEGPEDQLRLTYYTQPALLTMSVACLRVLQASLAGPLVPSFAAGHSLGEYSALVAAGSLTFSDAVRIVHLRGQFMDEAVPAGLGAMSAILGLDKVAIESICASVSTDKRPVELANLNCPGQIVISGEAHAVSQASDQLRAAGARVIELVVSGPFHSSLMKPAAEKLADELRGISIFPAKIPVVANVSAKAVTEPDEIFQALTSQVFSSVLWEDSVRYMLDQGVERFIELGSGTVLSGLIKKVNRKLPVHAASDTASLTALIQQLNE